MACDDVMELLRVSENVPCKALKGSIFKLTKALNNEPPKYNGVLLHLFYKEEQPWTLNYTTLILVL